MNLLRIAIRFLGGIFIGGMIYGFLFLPQLVRTQKSINILVLPNDIDASVFGDFEKKTGIRVYLSYFENYEELLVKMQSGVADYDLIMVSDYVVPHLIESDLVKPIDTTRCDFFNDLYPSLCNLPFDPKNNYTIPFSWSVYGLGIDRSYYGGHLPEATWGLLFDKEKSPAHVGMLNDAREVVVIAGRYLFGNDRSFTNEHFTCIQELLRDQKKRVVAYTDMRTDHVLISGSAPVVLGNSSDIISAMLVRDSISFVVPKEGGFIVVDSWLLPTVTKKESLVYLFLNYLYQPKIIQQYVDRYHFFPTLKSVEASKNPFELQSTEKTISQLYFFPSNINQERLHDLWIALKS